MTTVKRGSRLTAKIASALHQQKLRVAGVAAGIALREVLENTPEEDGHAHCAWMQGATDAAVGLGKPFNQPINAAVSPYVEASSGDPEAEKAGSGEVDADDKRVRIRIKNKLHFVSTLEHGGVIRPIAPGGAKEEPAAKRPGEKGPLFGDRKATGRGAVFFMNGGTPTWARFRAVPAGLFVKRAMLVTKLTLREAGLKCRGG